MTVTHEAEPIMIISTLDRMISGARYSGVPQRVQVLPLTRLAKPKSVTLNEETTSV